MSVVLRSYVAVVGEGTLRMRKGEGEGRNKKGQRAGLETLKRYYVGSY
jgi:hypothetical protein